MNSQWHKGPPCASELSSDCFGGAGFSLPIRAKLGLCSLCAPPAPARESCFFRPPCFGFLCAHLSDLCVSALKRLPFWFRLRLVREGVRQGPRHPHHSVDRKSTRLNSS